jgi:type I restriction enzyme S subunit
MKKGWETKRLGDIAVVGAGNSAPQDEALFKDGTIPFFRTADAGRVRFGDIGHSTDYLNEKGGKGLRRFAPGTILFPKSGASTFLNHRVMLAVDGCVSSHLATIVADKKQANPRFLLYFLSTIAAQDLVQDHSYPSLNLPTIAGIEIHFPSLAEQQRIVGLLDEAFEGIATAKANAEKNLQNARALFESHLQSVFSQRGKGWVEKSLVDICVVDWGNTKLTKSAYVEGGKYLAVSAAGCDGRIGHKEHAKHTPVLSAIGAQCGRMFLPEEDFTAIKNTITLTPRGNACTGKFLYRLLTHVDLPRRGAAQPFISKGDIQAFQVSIPESLSTQQKLEEELTQLEAETQRLASLYTRKLAALEALKKSLLHQAFSGEL